MIYKIDIVTKHLEFLYDLENDILMNLEINSLLNQPIQENEEELNRCLDDTRNKIKALKGLLTNIKEML